MLTSRRNRWALVGFAAGFALASFFIPRNASLSWDLDIMSTAGLLVAALAYILAAFSEGG